MKNFPSAHKLILFEFEQKKCSKIKATERTKRDDIYKKVDIDLLRECQKANIGTCILLV